MTRIIFVLIFGGWLLGASAGSRRLVASSGSHHVQLLELYSSESCSSCPPADQWIATLKNKPSLWKEVVPVVFHVDYWNDLGWKDGLSSNSMTKRQRDIAQTWATDSVYTPAFVADGREWRGWRSGTLPGSEGLAEYEIEIFEDSGGDFTVTVKRAHARASARSIVVRLATLGIGLTQKVTGGENAGKSLNHNFVVLDWDAHPLPPGAQSTSFHFAAPPQRTKPSAVAAWIERPGSPLPLQAAGGKL